MVITVTVQYAQNATNGSGNPLQGRPAAVSEPVTITPAVQDAVAFPVSSTEIDLYWSLNAANASAIQIERSTDGSNYSIVATLDPSSSIFRDTGLIAGAHRWYRVSAVQPAGNSVYAGPMDAFTLPTSPTGLIVSVISPTQVDLSWSSVSTAAGGYQIERSDDGINFYIVDTVDAGATSYSDTSVSDGASYTYRVRAANDGGVSDPSTAQSVATNLASPSDLTARAVSSSEIDLSWQDDSQAATSVIVQRKSDGSDFAPLTTLSADSGSYADTGLLPGVHYSYRVLAVTENAESGTSNVAEDTTVPGAPGSFSATAVSSSRVDLVWTSVSGVTGYQLDRSIGSAPFTTIATPSSTDTSYSDSALPDGTQFTYRLFAVNDAGVSTPITASAATATAAPGAPSGVQAVVLSASSVQLIWISNAYNEQGFHVRYSDDNGDNWSLLTDTAPGVTTCTDSGLNPSQSRLYSITAYNAAGESSRAQASATADGSSDTPAPARPTNLQATVAGTSVSLSWTASSTPGVTYWVERIRNSNAFDGDPSNWAVIGTTGFTTFNSPDGSGSPLLPGRGYSFRVRAVLGQAASDPSDSADVTMPLGTIPGPGNVRTYVVNDRTTTIF